MDLFETVATFAVTVFATMIGVLSGLMIDSRKKQTRKSGFVENIWSELGHVEAILRGSSEDKPVGLPTPVWDSVLNSGNFLIEFKGEENYVNIVDIYAKIYSQKYREQVFDEEKTKQQSIDTTWVTNGRIGILNDIVKLLNHNASDESCHESSTQIK